MMSVGLYERSHLGTLDTLNQLSHDGQSRTTNPKQRHFFFCHLCVVLTVGNFRGRRGVNLVHTGQWDVLSSTGDVGNIVERPLRLEGPIHQHVRVQTKHL